MSPEKPAISILLTALLFGASLWFLGFVPDQNEFIQIIIPYALAFLCYFGLLYLNATMHSDKLKWFLLLALIARIPLIVSWPNLSDDIYRFLWDGHLLIQGMSPFYETPIQVMNDLSNFEDPAPFIDLYPLLNSQEYFTVYPPLNQLLFSLGALLSLKNWLFGSAVLKLILVGIEWLGIGAMIRLLDHYGFSRGNVLLYALNPLIIIEGTGNLHFEPVMIAFFFLAMEQLVKKKLWRGGILFALSVLSKLQSVLFLPLFIRRLRSKVFLFYGIIGVLVFISFVPLLNHMLLGHMAESLDLYFRRFEFNASIYYVLRWIGIQWRGFNLIGILGPLSALLSVIGIIFLYLREKEQDPGPGLYRTALFAFCLYLFFGTTIHPWYVCFPVALSIFTRFRFPILWSALIPLTYINYSYPEYTENLYLVAIEYILVYGYLFIELYPMKGGDRK